MRDEITVLKVEPGKPPEIVSMANTLRAVSYTHLDVYKRQVDAFGR